MDYNLTVVILLVICFIFAYETLLNLSEYASNDCSVEREWLLCSIFGSTFLATVFGLWAWYEYKTYNNELSSIMKDVKKADDYNDYRNKVNSEDPNILSAAKKNQPESIYGPVPILRSQYDDVPQSKFQNEEVNKYMATNADEAKGEITEGFTF